VLEETHDREEIIQRVAALDIGKAELVCCVRVPSLDTLGRRLQEVRTYATMTRSLLAMSDRLRQVGVTRVVMEATSEYWKPAFYLLEAHGFETWLVNARDVKHLPGRPKTDRLDAVWLAKVAERQMLRPSFVPPPEIRRLRDLTRYRADLVAARTAEQHRVEKLLEDAQIKLSVVAADSFGVSGRAMMAALIAGERDPKVLAQLARGRLRAKLRGPRAATFPGEGESTQVRHVDPGKVVERGPLCASTRAALICRSVVSSEMRRPLRYLAGLTVPISTAPVSSATSRPASMPASIVSAEVSGSPFTLCASGRGPKPKSVDTAAQPLVSPSALQITK
jgi:hypothetical protein